MGRLLRGETPPKELWKQKVHYIPVCLDFPAYKETYARWLENSACKTNDFNIYKQLSLENKYFNIYIFIQSTLPAVYPEPYCINKNGLLSS